MIFIKRELTVHIMEKAISEAGRSYNGIDIIKFIMSIFMVIIHAKPLLEISYWGNYALTYGITRVTVPFFFIASGFLLFKKMSLYDIDVKKIKKYIYHIFRLYMIWTVIYLPIIFWEVHKNENGILHGIIIAIRNTIMAGSYFQLWFLNALIVSAILISLFLWLKINIKKIFVFTIFMYIIALLGQSYYGIFDYLFPEGSTMFTIWKYIGIVFRTPRNGLCFGALFFFLGAYISRSKDIISIKKTIVCLLISCILLMVEVIGGKYFNITREADVYISLIPVAYFLFLFAKNISIRDSPLWVYLRKQSMFIFYIHAWWLFLVYILFRGRYAIVQLNSFQRFVIVLSLSVITSHIIIKLSEKKRFSFLRYLS